MNDEFDRESRNVVPLVQGLGASPSKSDIERGSLRKRELPRIQYNRLAVSTAALIFVCGCQLAKHIERNTEAIEENRRTVEKTTQAIRNNAKAIDENTAKITANRDTVENASDAITANVVAVSKSTVGIQANELTIEESTRAIVENKAAIEHNTHAIIENERIITESTATIMKNAAAAQKVAMAVEVISAHRRLFAVIVFVALILLVGPSILMLITLRRTERALNSVLRVYKVRIDRPEQSG